MKLFENGYHEMQHDEECDELIATVTEWILKRADKAKPFGNTLKCSFFVGNLLENVYEN